MLIPVISLGYYVMRTAYKYRLDRLNWNKTFHVCFFLKDGLLLASRLKMQILPPSGGRRKDGFATI